MDNAKKTAPETARNEKIYFLVIEYIKTLVQNGEIAFGGKLPSERELITTLGLSRNSIREALRSLENMGIIESRHGQGNYLVNHIGQSLSSIFSLLLLMKECSYLEINQLRRSVEIGAYLLAIERVSAIDIQRLAYFLEEMKNSSLTECIKLDKQFHDTLIEFSGNRLLKLLNEALASLFESSIREILLSASTQTWENLLFCHADIYESLRARDEQRGIAAITAHYDFIDKITVNIKADTEIENV